MFSPASLALVFGPQLCLLALLIVGAIRSGRTPRIMLWVSVGCSVTSLIFSAVGHLMLGSQPASSIAWINTISGFFNLATWVLALLVIILTRPGVRNDPPSDWPNPNPFGY